MMAIRDHAGHTNGLPAPVLLGVVRDTLPGVSVVAQSLRNPKIWPTRAQVANHYENSTGYRSGSGIEAVGIEAEAESLARRESAWEVGERHILSAIAKSWFQEVGVQYDALAWAVHLAELGPATLGDISSRWHGLIDSNIVLQFRDLKEIEWLVETKASAATLWLSVSLLDELEHLKYQSGSRRARERAERFTKEIGRQLDELVLPTGKQIRSNVQLRLWSAPGVTGMGDDDHLQTARTLRLRGVQIAIVTADVGVQARARLAGFEVFQPSDRWLLPKEPTPIERELQARLAAAGIRQPPTLGMTFELAGPISAASMNYGTLFVRADELRGEATDVQCAWTPEGGSRVDCVEMSVGKTMLRHQDGRYHASVSGPIAPGRAESVALMYFEQPPSRLKYVVRATGATQDGILEFKDGLFIESEV